MAGTEVGSLYYDLTIDDGNLKKNLADSTKTVTSFGEKVSAAGEKISAGLRAASKSLAVVGVGLTAYAKSATDYTTDFVKSSKALAREIGVSTTEASRLTAAFNRMGIEASSAQQMFGIFSKQISASTQNSTANQLAFQKLQVQIQQTQQQITATTDEIKKNGDKSGELTLKVKELTNTLASQKNALKQNADAFQQLGISTTDQSGKQKDFNTLLFEVADKFKVMPDGIDKTTLAMQLFGRSGKDMIKVLNLGSQGIQDLEKQADKLGLTLTPDTVAKVEALIKSQKDLKEQTDALKIAVGTATAPPLTKFNKGLNDIVGNLIAANSPMKNITTNVLAFGGPVASASSGLTAFLGNLGSIGPVVAKVALGMGVFALVIAALVGGAFLLEQHFGSWQATLTALSGYIMAVVTPTFNTLKLVFDVMWGSMVAVWNSIVTMLAPAFGQLWEAIMRLWNAIQPAFLEGLKYLAEIIGLLIVAAVWLFINVLNVLVKILSFVVSVISNVINWIANLISWFGNAIAAVGNFAATVIYWFMRLPGTVSNVIGQIINFFRSFGSQLAGAMGNVASVVEAPFKTAFNAIASFWNNTVGKLSFNAPSWVPGIGGKGFSMPKLPILDTGGIVTKPTIAALAVNSQPEAIVPLNDAGSLGNTYHIGQVILDTAEAVNTFFNINDRNIQLESMGVGPIRG